MPTVVSPELYRTRFLQAMNRYFLLVPDQWTGMDSAVNWPIHTNALSGDRTHGVLPVITGQELCCCIINVGFYLTKLQMCECCDHACAKSFILCSFHWQLLKAASRMVARCCRLLYICRNICMVLPPTVYLSQYYFKWLHAFLFLYVIPCRQPAPLCPRHG